MSSECKIDGCEQPARGHGLCGKHYMRQRRTGDAMKVRPPGVPGSARKHFMYGAWGAMVNRCHNPSNSSFPRYGAVGVTVCDRWRFGQDGQTGFECFLSDMGERPEGKTLDRIIATGPYDPANCRWATPQEQRANLSPDGDKRMRDAVGAGVRRYWESRRKVQSA